MKHHQYHWPVKKNHPYGIVMLLTEYCAEVRAETAVAAQPKKVHIFQVV